MAQNRQIKEKTMAKKAIFWAMLVIVLAFGMTVVGCDDGSDDGPTDSRKTDLIIGGGDGNGKFSLYLSDSSNTPVSWKSGITGTEVLNWLTFSIPANMATLGYGDFTGLQVDSVEATAQPTIIHITISYTSQINPGGAFANACNATVTIKDDAATLSAIKAKTNSVETLVVKPENKSETKLLLKRS